MAAKIQQKDIVVWRKENLSNLKKLTTEVPSRDLFFKCVVVGPILVYASLVWWLTLNNKYNRTKANRIRRAPCIGAYGLLSPTWWMPLMYFYTSFLRTITLNALCRVVLSEFVMMGRKLKQP